MEKENIIFAIEVLKEVKEEIRKKQEVVNKLKNDDINQLQIHYGGVLCGYSNSLIEVNSKISYLEGFLKEL